MEEYDYQLKGGSLKIKVIDVEVWDVIGIRSDNGKKDVFPITYFKKHFDEIKKNDME